MNDTNYIKNDLEDYATEPSSIEDYPNRSNLIESAVNPDSMEYYSTGGYQGEMVFVLRKGGYIWVIKESYGSCSYCDGLLAADDDWEYTKKMLRNAYCFESKSDAITFLEEKESGNGYIWNRVAKNGIECVESIK